MTQRESMSMINLGLSRISRLLALSPTKQTWKAIHIAGTNGKGSVSAYLSSLLQRLGSTAGRSDAGAKQETIKVGKFTSPHLIDRWDCITINDKPVERTLFESTERQVQQRAETVKAELLKNAASYRDGHDHEVRNSNSAEQDATVTSFEMLTATAFEIFSQQKCHVAIIECGLGGRLDATNALKPEEVAVSVITRIGLDHQGLLGNTVEAIATEKAGIAKPGVPLVLDEANEKAIKEAIEQDVGRRKAGPVIESNIEALRRFLPSSEPLDFDPPYHQMENFATAFTVLQKLRKLLSEPASGTEEHKPLQQITLAEESASLLREVFQYVQKTNSGRLQTLDLGWTRSLSGLQDLMQPVLLDGAHNTQSAHVLRQYINSRLLPKKDVQAVCWIIAMSKGKNAEEILDILIRPGDLVIFCEFGPVGGMPWVKPMSTQSLLQVMEQRGLGSSVRAQSENIHEALRWICNLSGETDKREIQERCLVIAGSLYLVSDLHRLLRDGVEPK